MEKEVEEKGFPVYNTIADICILELQITKITGLLESGAVFIENFQTVVLNPKLYFSQMTMKQIEAFLTHYKVYDCTTIANRKFKSKVGEDSKLGSVYQGSQSED